MIVNLRLSGGHLHARRRSAQETQAQTDPSDARCAAGDTRVVAMSFLANSKRHADFLRMIARSMSVAGERYGRAAEHEGRTAPSLASSSGALNSRKPDIAPRGPNPV